MIIIRSKTIQRLDTNPDDAVGASRLVHRDVAPPPSPAAARAPSLALPTNLDPTPGTVQYSGCVSETPSRPNKNSLSFISINIS